MDLHQRSLGADVRQLGDLLGSVVAEQASPAAFEAVEDLRTTAIAYRDGDLDSRDPLRARLGELDDDVAGTVARAFTVYFQLVNLVEERERIRALRASGQSGTTEGSLRATAEALSAADRDRVERVLADVLVEPTFTSHPTEARRKTVKARLRAIAGHLERLDECRLTDAERARVERDLEAEVTTLWGTALVREGRPEPGDEARNVEWYLENTLLDVVGDVYDDLEGALAGAFDDAVAVPQLLAFRSWAGGDRDGNPHVTPDVTAETLARQRAVALERYRADIDRLSTALSQHEEAVDVGADFAASLAADREHLPAVAEAASERHPGEPYRQKLALMRARLDRVGDRGAGGYADASELAADLDTVAASLAANGAGVVAETHVRPVARRVETFGFSLASLDLRDHRENHTEAVAAGLAREGVDYRGLPEDERVEVLTDAVLADGSAVDLADREGLSPTAARVFERFDHLGGWQADYGVDAVDAYCISMTERPSHVLEVLALADAAGVVSVPGRSDLDVVPLLETEAALSGARELMETLFDNEAYAPALAARGDVQEVMLGYSDSGKENGFLAANWSLYENGRRLARICSDHDVTLRLFHGRGGSISRGGGPMNEALLALPNETVTGPVKFTEQGEAIAEKYGNPRIARRNLEQMLDAQLRARLDALERPTEPVEPGWADAAESMADAARSAYRDLLSTEGFVAYFERATPIAVIEDLNLGSRPASRTGERTVEDLRAIPWVFAWTQSRCIVPGWYGLGAGVEAFLAEGDVETLRTLYAEWPFFRTTVDNAALALARTDMEIAAEYAALAPDRLRERFLPRLRAEYERSVDAVLSATGREHLLSREWLRESLRRRNPYVDPLNLLQVELLGREERSPAEERTLRLTVMGIAAGMKNTG